MAGTTTDRRQGITSNTAVKVPVVVATTGNITLSGEQTVDGVAVVTDDRVLVKNQTDGTENGIYIVNSSSWTRAPDWDGSLDVVRGTAVFAVQGDSTSGWWYVSTANPITIGTSSISFSSTLLQVAHRGCLTYANSAQTIPTATVTDVLFNVDTYDTDAIHNVSTNTDELVVPAGVTRIQLFGQVVFESNATGVRRLRWTKDGATNFAGNGRQTNHIPDGAVDCALQAITAPLVVSGGEVFTLQAFQTTTGNLDTVAGVEATWASMLIIE